ncbi:MAG: TOBE-like domain-containing protein [Alphaproteobacteria bacterium]
MTILLNGTDVPDGIDATAFFRPHDLELASGTEAKSIRATVRHISVLGANVCIDLAAGDLPLEAEIPHGQFDEPTIKQGDRVAVVPNDPKIFSGALPKPIPPAS